MIILTLFFKNFICKLQLPFEWPINLNAFKNLHIGNAFGNEFFGNLVIENSLSLENLLINQMSLINTNALKIRNNRLLKTIEIDSNCFQNTVSIEISGNFHSDF